MEKNTLNRKPNRMTAEKRHRQVLAIIALSLFLFDLAGERAHASADTAKPTLAERRRAFAANPGYDAYKLQIQEGEAVNESRKFWNQKRYDEAYQRMFDFLKEYPLSILAVESLRKMSASQSRYEIDPEKKKRAEVLLTASEVQEDEFLRTIFSSGDGKSPATAYWVLTINEEYYIINRLGYKHKEQALLSVSGKKIDELKTVGEKGDARTFYFDVSHFSSRGTGATTQPSANGGPANNGSNVGKEQVEILLGNAEPNKPFPPLNLQTTTKKQTEIPNPHPFRPRETIQAKIAADRQQN
ncbi:MAG: DUF4919 domain-containing protein [Pseudomonadota bacterium]